MIAAQGIKVYVPPVEVDDEASAEHSQALMVSGIIDYASLTRAVS